MPRVSCSPKRFAVSLTCLGTWSTLALVAHLYHMYPSLFTRPCNRGLLISADVVAPKKHKQNHEASHSYPGGSQDDQLIIAMDFAASIHGMGSPMARQVPCKLVKVRYCKSRASQALAPGHGWGGDLDHRSQLHDSRPLPQGFSCNRLYETDLFIG